MDFSMLRTTSKVVDEWKYPQAEPHRSGMLLVDPLARHELYWEEYGNPQGEPVMVLHGGPGGACMPAMSRYFDPDRYRVILFDQRGCGKSRPTVASAGPEVALANNTTDHLVHDINALREALQIEGRMHVFGGSWGSTLSLVYATRHPQFVRSLVLRGIFLGEQGDLDYMYQGNAQDYARQPYALTAPGAYIFYPEQWRAFLEPIPDDQRANVAHAYKAIFDMRPATEDERTRQLRAAVAWSVWEGAISNTIPEPAGADKFADPDFAVCFAQIEAHYFANHLFLDDGYIVRNAVRLAALPTYIVHGRFDQACPISQAGRLVSALESHGSHPLLVITDAGHSAMERETVLALTAIMDGLPQ